MQIDKQISRIRYQIDKQIPRYQIDKQMPRYQMNKQISRYQIDKYIPRYQIDRQIPRYQIDKYIPRYYIDKQITRYQTAILYLFLKSASIDLNPLAAVKSAELIFEQSITTGILSLAQNSKYIANEKTVYKQAYYWLKLCSPTMIG